MKQVADVEVKLAPPQVVEATALRIWRPAAEMRPTALLLGHAAGSALDERVLVAVASGLSSVGVTVGTFNFPYRQAGGRRPPDRADRLRSAFADVAGAFAAGSAARTVVIGGRSMGGRIASLLAADGVGDGVVALGYPLCPGGRMPPDPRRSAHWPRLTVPVLFVHGDRDRLCPVPELDAVRTEHLGSAAHSAHVIAGADHGFRVLRGGLRSREEVIDELVGTIDAWLSGTFEEGRDMTQRSA